MDKFVYTKMYQICQVCLRTDRKLRIIDEKLSNWHDELCEYAMTCDSVQFCTECEHLLRKFYFFKEKCILAAKVFKNWKKQKAAVREPIDSLHLELPPSPLTICNKNNVKICAYREPQDSVVFIPINSNPELVAVDLNQEDLVNTTSNSQPSVYNVNRDDIIEGTVINIEMPDKTEQQLDTMIELNVNDIENYNNSSETSKCNMNQVPNDAIKKSNRVTTENVNLKSKNRKRTLPHLVKHVITDGDVPMQEITKSACNEPFTVETLKNLLIRKFATVKDIRDNKGNVIDKESVLNILNNMNIPTMKLLHQRCSATTTLTPKAIEHLSQVLKRYGDQYSTVFITEYLNSTEQILAEFDKRKHYEAYVASEYKCELCFRGFKHRKLLEYHEKIAHDPSLPYVCNVCQVRYKTRAKLQIHWGKHRAVFKCKVCPLVTMYRTVMEGHYYQHMGVVLKCDLCPRTFRSKPCLSAHMNNMHRSKHLCCLCARNFTSALGLLIHRTRKHANEEMTESPDNVTCEFCEAKFVSVDVYQKHIKISHTEMSEKDPKVYVYRKRNRKKSRSTTCVCQVCEHVENSIGRLMSHHRQEHPNVNFEQLYRDKKKILCHICGKGYNCIQELEEHKNVHTGARPYACDKCPKTFHRRANLRIHQERHLPPARVCHHCGKKFVSAANLNNHILVHIGIRRYTCELCEKRFLNRAALNEHVRGVHLQIRREKKQTPKKELADTSATKKVFKKELADSSATKKSLRRN